MCAPSERGRRARRRERETWPHPGSATWATSADTDGLQVLREGRVPARASPKGSSQDTAGWRSTRLTTVGKSWEVTRVNDSSGGRDADSLLFGDQSREGAPSLHCG